MDIDLSINLGGLTMKNPVTVASGTFGSGKEYHQLYDVSCLGAITTKGVSYNPWEGNKSPRMAEVPSGMLNSIGLQNPGVKGFVEQDIPFLESLDTPVIVNVSGHTIDEYRLVIEYLESCACVSAYELNISCPNVDAGGMSLGTSCSSVVKLVKACRAVTKRPLIVKLSPNVTDIVQIALSAQEAGADALSLINTLLGMAIDVRTRKPKLARVVGGLSGPCIKPVALRMVWQCAQAVEIPILALGGIETGEDALEFILAGASAIAIGTANFINPFAARDCVLALEEYCREQKISSLEEIRGALEYWD